MRPKAQKRKTSATPFDAILKQLVEAHPLDWVRYLGLSATTAEVIDADLATVSTEADRIIRAVTPDGVSLVHFEFQTGKDAAAVPGRLLRYNVLLSEREEMPVHTVVVPLHRGADSPAVLTGHLERRRLDGSVYLTFEYSVIRPWELSPQVFLQSGLGLLPLAPLANVSAAELPKVIQQMGHQIQSEHISPDQTRVLWMDTYLLMGLIYPPEFVADILKGVEALKESSTYQAILAEGRAEGRQEGRMEGRQEGQLEGERRLLLLMGGKRLGEPDAATRAAVEAISTSEHLERLSLRVFEVESWEELLRTTP